MGMLERLNDIDSGNSDRRAILDVAATLGGEGLVEKIKPSVTDRSETYPIESWKELINEYPEAQELVFNRSRQISRQIRIHQITRRITGEPLRSSASWIAEYGPYLNTDTTPKKRITNIFKKK